MKLQKTKIENYSSQISEYYYFDWLGNVGSVAELFNLLKNHGMELVNFDVWLDHDHTSEGRPIDFDTLDELVSFLRRCEMDEVDQITFDGRLHNEAVYGHVIPRTAILHVMKPI